MEHLFSYNSSESEDFYKILGCSQHSNVKFNKFSSSRNHLFLLT